MRRSTLDIASKEIISAFAKTNQKVFTLAEVDSILDENRDSWNLAERIKVKRLCDFLINKADFELISLQFPHFNSPRLITKSPDIYEIASSLNPKAYFSHYSAAFLHNLTNQEPKTIYLNIEQPVKPAPKGELLQANIDRAFANKQRISSNAAVHNNYKIVLLNGKNTDRLGLEEQKDASGRPVSVTSIERTLIDITVRPSYAGGIFEVINIFQNAKKTVSINKLCSMLKKLDYIYPYHQSIGFLLEKAGVYSKSQLDLLKKIPQKYKFYLIYGMKEKNFSKEWNLYYPKDLN